MRLAVRPDDGVIELRRRSPREDIARTALTLVTPHLVRLAHLAGRTDRRIVEAASPGRHPLVPAALRVERARWWGRRRSGEQVAVTVWFGDGPALPAGGAREGAGRVAMRVGAGLLGAAALAAVSTAAARLQAGDQPPRIGAAPQHDARR